MICTRIIAEKGGKKYDADGDEEEWDNAWSTEVSSYFENLGKTTDIKEEISGGSSVENEKC